MIYHNILSNPTLQTVNDGLHVEPIHVLDFPPQEIWHPVQWKTTVTPTVRGQYTKRQTEQHIIPTVWPQTVEGFTRQLLTIEANTKHFVVKLEQMQIPLKAHQRYLVKVVFNPAVEPGIELNGEVMKVDPADLSWRITVDKRSNEFTDGFQSATSTQEWGQERSALLVFHSFEAQAVDLWVEFWSKWGNLDKQIYIQSIEILEVERGYGDGGNVHLIGTPTPEPPPPPPVPDPDPSPLPDPVIPTFPAWGVFVFGIIGAILAGVVVYSILAPRLVAMAQMETSLMEELLNQLFAIPALASIAYTAGIILFLVEAVKRAKARWLPNQLVWVTPQLLVVFLVALFMGAHELATVYQYDNVLKDVAKFLSDLIDALGPYALKALGTAVVATVGYKAARKRDIVGFNFGK